MAELSKLTMEELQKSVKSGAIGFDAYNAEVIRRTAPATKTKAFSLKATDKGQIAVTVPTQQFPLCFNVEGLQSLLDNSAKALEFIKANGAELSKKRDTYKSSEDYKSACAARREAFKVSKSAT